MPSEASSCVRPINKLLQFASLNLNSSTPCEPQILFAVSDKHLKSDPLHHYWNKHAEIWPTTSSLKSKLWSPVLKIHYESCNAAFRKQWVLGLMIPVEWTWWNTVTFNLVYILFGLCSPELPTNIFSSKDFWGRGFADSFSVQLETLAVLFISIFTEHGFMILSISGLFMLQKNVIIEAKHTREKIFMPTDTDFIDINKSQKGFAQKVIFITASNKFAIDELCPEQEIWFVITNL